MRDQYMRGGEGFIICYSITDRRSFLEASEFKKVIERVRNTDEVPVVLVGNKYDLEQRRVVSSKSNSSELFYQATAQPQNGLDLIYGQTFLTFQSEEILISLKNVHVRSQ